MEPTPQRRPYDTEKVTATVLASAREQISPECRENYLKSCEAHGGELAVIAGQVREILKTNT